jgi:hypothetical protein
MDWSDLSMESRVESRKVGFEIFVGARLLTAIGKSASETRIVKRVKHWIIEHLARIDVRARHGDSLAMVNRRGQARSAVLLAETTHCACSSRRSWGYVV